jgi:hypothetical protein
MFETLHRCVRGWKQGMAVTEEMMNLPSTVGGSPLVILDGLEHGVMYCQTSFWAIWPSIRRNLANLGAESWKDR